jgi:hypothetical protein
VQYRRLDVSGPPKHDPVGLPLVLIAEQGLLQQQAAFTRDETLMPMLHCCWSLGNRISTLAGRNKGKGKVQGTWTIASWWRYEWVPLSWIFLFCTGGTEYVLAYCCCMQYFVTLRI